MLPRKLAADIVVLYKDDERFRNILDHFKHLERALQEEINYPGTPKDEREILVHVRSKLKSEVVDILKTAQKVLAMKDESVPDKP